MDRTAGKGPRTPATLRDVAKSAGVSMTTVSRILNDRPTGIPISESTRQRVRDAAAAVGYTPNLLARGLRGSASSLLGVIARDISDPFHIQILRGVNRIVQKRGYRLFLGHIENSPEAALAYGSMFERSHADGIMVIGDIEDGEPTLERLAEQHKFVVGVTDRTQRREIPGVYADSATGTDLAMEHLWSLGHRDIICVSDMRTYDGRMRIDRYQQFMQEHGAGELARVYVTNQEPQPGYELGARIFAGALGTATAMYITSDWSAVGVMTAAFQAGVRIPADLSIVGYDDIDVAPYTAPPLTTVSQSGVEMGEAAAQVLLDMIDGDLDRSEVEDVVLEPTLVVRESTSRRS